VLQEGTHVENATVLLLYYTMSELTLSDVPTPNATPDMPNMDPPAASTGAGTHS
jgi:hypothetical protein